MSGMASGLIFLSYRRDDTQHVAGRLRDRLAERFGDANVFMDVDSIEPGLDFSEAIERAVSRCDVLLALIGTRWLRGTDEHGPRRLDDPDDLVLLEIKSALERDVLVIPVLVDGAKTPRRNDLPEILAPLARRNAVQLDHETFRTDLGPLIDVLDRAVQATNPTAAADSTSTGLKEGKIDWLKIEEPKPVGPAPDPHRADIAELREHLLAEMSTQLRNYILANEPAPDDGMTDEERLTQLREGLQGLESDVSYRLFSGEDYDDGISTEDLRKTQDKTREELDREERRQRAKFDFGMRDKPPDPQL